MKYIDYFSVFLGIEQKLSKYFNQLEYNARTKSIFSYPISLFLLQICPVIESYMVDLCINSNTVQNSDLFSWQYNYMIWQKKREKGSIELKTDKSGKRSISGFPKFSYVIEKCFKISSHTVAFNPNKYFHAYGENICLRSYQSLSKFVDYQDFDINWTHRSEIDPSNA